jgi:hypothetical protein
MKFIFLLCATLCLITVITCAPKPRPLSVRKKTFVLIYNVLLENAQVVPRPSRDSFEYLIQQAPMECVMGQMNLTVGANEKFSESEMDKFREMLDNFNYEKFIIEIAVSLCQPGGFGERTMTYDKIRQKYTNANVRNYLECFQKRVHDIDPNSRLVESFNVNYMRYGESDCDREISNVLSLVDSEYGRSPSQCRLNSRENTLHNSYLLDLYKKVLIANTGFSSSIIDSEVSRLNSYETANRQKLLRCILSSPVFHQYAFASPYYITSLSSSNRFFFTSIAYPFENDGKDAMLRPNVNQPEMQIEHGSHDKFLDKNYEKRKYNYNRNYGN